MLQQTIVNKRWIAATMPIGQEAHERFCVLTLMTTWGMRDWGVGLTATRAPERRGQMRDEPIPARHYREAGKHSRTPATRLTLSPLVPTHRRLPRQDGRAGFTSERQKAGQSYIIRISPTRARRSTPQACFAEELYHAVAGVSSTRLPLFFPGAVSPPPKEHR